MTIRSILVHLSDDERNATLTEVGLDLAGKHDAKLIALYTSNPWQLPTDVLGYVPPELIDRYAEDVQRAAGNAKKQFDSAVAATTVASEWRHVEGFAHDVTVTHSRYADLTIVGQANSDNAAAPQGLPDAVMLSAGRPVLIIPYVGKFSAIGNKILIAWNGTREAARAVGDALPFLKAAKETLVVGVDTMDDQHVAGADLATYLAQHGVTVNVRPVVAPDISVSDALLDAVADYSCDMIVMGGYGHSRLRELAFGGTTRHIMDHMTVPVLMSH